MKGLFVVTAAPVMGNVCTWIILISGAGVARGYLGRVDLTAERFVPDPFATTGKTMMYKSAPMHQDAAKANEASGGCVQRRERLQERLQEGQKIAPLPMTGGRER